MKPNILLSICIPTYNRCEQVVSAVQSVLELSSEEFEIVVLDNCSTDNSLSRLRAISDRRLRILQNEHNIGGILNGIKVLSLGIGKFSLLCLDKDTIDPVQLRRLLMILAGLDGVSAGYISGGDLSDSRSVVRHPQGVPALMAMGYRQRHPSGYFFQTSSLVTREVLSRFSDPAVVGGFGCEFFFADLCTDGDVVEVCLPLIQTEARSEAGASKSLTYSPKANNLFFSPKNRLRVYSSYLRQINGFLLPSPERLALLSMISRGTLQDCVFGFKAVMADPDLCSHYGIHTRSISAFEQVVTLISSIIQQFFALKFVPLGDRVVILVSATRFGR